MRSSVPDRGTLFAKLRSLAHIMNFTKIRFHMILKLKLENEFLKTSWNRDRDLHGNDSPYY